MTTTTRAVDRIEALTDALASLNNWTDPRTPAYQNRNPLLLKALLPDHKRDERGRRVFERLAAGYDNARNDVGLKVSGRSTYCNLTVDSTLTDLVAVYGHDRSRAADVKKFLRAALRDDSIRECQRLGWFVNDGQGDYKYVSEAEEGGVIVGFHGERKTARSWRTGQGSSRKRHSQRRANQVGRVQTV